MAAQSKVQAENAKIQEAMKARRAEAQRRRRAAAKVAAEQKDVNARLGIPTSENGVRVEAGKAAVLEGIRGILAGTTTADEVLASPAVAAVVKAPRVRKVKHADGSTTSVDLTVRTPEEAAVALDVIQAEAQVQAEAVHASTTKAVRVLPDPVDNARLIRMRAKWTAERRERDVARLEEMLESAKTPQERREISGRMKVAKSVLVEAEVAERRAYKAYRDLLAARKAKAD